MSESVRLVEVGPRDGLQNEMSRPSAQVKVELISRLFDAGIRRVEAGAFVSPRWVPQMADSGTVIAALKPPAGAEIIALVPNEAGLTPALETGVDTIAVFAAASETFSRKNTNCTINESLSRIAAIVGPAQAAGRRVRGYISCVVGCPYEGSIPVAAVVRVAEALDQLGCDEIVLGDTIGVARPSDIRALLAALAPSIPVGRIAIHAHDTYGMGVANVLAAVEAGVRAVDASVAGLGGCPYAPGASGNVATEDVVYLLEGLGLTTGVDLDALTQVGTWICGTLGRANASRVGSVIAARRSAEPA